MPYKRIVSTINRTREMYRAQYFHQGEWTSWAAHNPDVWARIETATSLDDARAVLGACWWAFRCDECGTDIETAVQIGDEPDYESVTVVLCQACCDRLVTFLTERTSPEGEP